MTAASPIDRRGVLAAVAAYVMWGVFPLYWALLKSVPSVQIVAHRVIWCGVFVVGWLLLRDGASWLRSALRGRNVAPMLLASSLLISTNWGLFIWSVTHGHVVEASLGYFINPLVNIVIGVMFLRERLSMAQWSAVGVAALGVLWLALIHGDPPWIALALALSFSLYGLIRKVAAVDAVPGLAIESLFLCLPALAWLLWEEYQGVGAFGGEDWNRNLLLIFGGALTALPLIGFAYGARRIPYSLIGILQYIGPSLQLLAGVLLMGEVFGADQAIGFGCIWLALIVYAVDGWRRARRARKSSAAVRCDENIPPCDGATPAFEEVLSTSPGKRD